MMLTVDKNPIPRDACFSIERTRRLTHLVPRRSDLLSRISKAGMSCNMLRQCAEVKKEAAPIRFAVTPKSRGKDSAFQSDIQKSSTDEDTQPRSIEYSRRDDRCKLESSVSL